MPIKGLSENRRLPRLGKIRLGIKKANAKGIEYPTAVDYFVCPDPIKAIYGETPRELPILIPVEDEEKWCSQYYKAYSKTRGLICKGDGEFATRLIDAKTGDLTWKDEATEVTMKEVACRGRDCPDYQAKRCKEVMMLQFLLPEVPGLGIWQIDTSSVNAILNINSAAELIRRIHGRVSMIPLLLMLELQIVKTPGQKKVNKPIMHLRAAGTLRQMLESANEYRALPEGREPEVEGVIEEEIDELILPGNQASEDERPEPEFDETVPELGKPAVNMPRAKSANLVAKTGTEGKETKDWDELTNSGICQDCGKDAGHLSEYKGLYICEACFSAQPEGE